MKLLTFFFSSFLVSATVFSQESKGSDLFNTAKLNDSLLFQVGFNTCDISQFERLVSDNFEFYHDQAGVTSSKATFISSIRDGLCKLSYRAKRVVDESSLQVYPLKKEGKLYGAIQMGTHRFYALEKVKPEYLTSVAQFTHLWLLENGQWRLSRGFSYNHEDQDKRDDINEKLLFIDIKETEKWLIKNRIPALGIGYIKEGKIQQQKVFGVLEKGRPAKDNTIFNVASLTKPVTALVALKLINEGKWSLDEPVFHYWTDPDISTDPRTKKLTTRHILSHQSGFPNWRYKNPEGKLIFEFEPGTKYQYSGEGFEYLRKALEKKFNQTLDQLADELIFKQLKMNDTYFFWSKAVDDGRFAKWHTGSGTVYETDKNNSANAADDLLTTIGDYCKFMVHVLEGAGLSTELYQQMISNQVRVKPNKYFGLGWMVDENIGNGEFAITHSGDDKGVHTIVFILPKSKQGLVLFTNCDNGTDIYIQTILAYLGNLGQGIIDAETK